MKNENKDEHVKSSLTPQFDDSNGEDTLHQKNLDLLLPNIVK